MGVHYYFSLLFFIFSFACSLEFSSDSNKAIVCLDDDVGSASFHSIDFSTGIAAINPVLSGKSFSTSRIEIDYIDNLAKILVASREERDIDDQFDHKLFLIDVENDTDTPIFDFTSNSLGCIDSTFSSAGSILTFCADEDENSTFSLFANDIGTASNGTSIELAHFPGSPEFFKISPDGKYLVYVEIQGENGVNQHFLKSVNLENIDFSNTNDELCVPIRGQNNRISLVCL